MPLFREYLTEAWESIGIHTRVLDFFFVAVELTPDRPVRWPHRQGREIGRGND